MPIYLRVLNPVESFDETLLFCVQIHVTVMSFEFLSYVPRYYKYSKYHLFKDKVSVVLSNKLIFFKTNRE